jgi:membrane fusion protein (multidrug efflux system)
MNRVQNLMKRGWKSSLAIGGLVALMVHASGACHRKVGDGRLDVAAGRPAHGLATVQALRQPETERLELVGTAASHLSVNLSARINAYVNDVQATAGDRVKAGQKLVVLDDREIREQLTAAEAQMKQADTEFKRARQLFAANAFSEQALTAAEAEATSAKAQVDRIRVLLTYAQVTAPMAGVVTERRVEVGDLASAGQVLLVLYDPTRMRLEVPVPVRLLDRLPLGRTLEVQLDYPSRVVTGQVTEVVSEIDADSRTRKVKLLLQDDSGDVLPGAFGRIGVEDSVRDCVSLPARAVLRRGQLEMVEVVEGERAVQRLVRTRTLDADRVEILSGLSGGETVVVPEAGN